MKYMGSKSRISKYILPIILKDRKEGQWYVEPMVGGGNLIDKVTGNRIGSDINKYLISFLKAMQLNYFMPYLTREQVTHVKNNKNEYPDYIVGWAGFCCSYSGKFFGGYAGSIVTKEGNKRDYITEAINNYQKQSSLIKGVKLYNISYDLLYIPKNSIIYLDPPYKGTEGYRIKFDHELFYEWCRKMKNIGHTVFISEYSMPEDFICIWSKELSSSLSANGKSGGNKKSVEKLFTL